MQSSREKQFHWRLNLERGRAVSYRDCSIVIGRCVGLGADDRAAPARLAIPVVVAEGALVERDLAAAGSVGLDMATLLEHRF